MGFRVAVKIFAIFAISSAACGTEPAKPVEPAELAELCGATEPIRLLGVAPGRELESAWHRGVVGERRLLDLYYADADPGDEVLWSVGLCGEAPRQLFSGNYSIWIVAGFDDPFVNDETGEVFVVDPSGERPPKLVFELPAHAHLERSDAGLVIIEPDVEGSTVGDLVLHPWPDDVWVDEVVPVVLLEGVKTHYMATPYQSGSDVLQGSEGEVFVMTTADELVRVNVETGEIEVEATGVRAFGLGYVRDDSELGSARRYVIWQDTALSNEDPDHPEGEIWLLDRTTGEQTSLGHTSLESRALSWSGYGIAQLHLQVDDQLVLRLFHLPSLSHIDVAPTVALRHMFADERHAVVSPAEGEALAILDVQTGEIESLVSEFTDPGVRWWSEQQSLALLPTGAAGAESELWLVDGAEPPQLIAKRATYHHQPLSGGRLLTGVNLDEDAIGDLIIVDLDSATERLVDRGVVASHVSLAPDVGDDAVVYSIVAGERAGVWLARLEPRD